MRLKNLLILALTLCLTLCLCACGGNSDKTTDPTEAQNVETDSGVKVTYTVTVEDAFGDPIYNANVQLKADSVWTSVTNEQGVATFTVPRADYKVSIEPVPVGYAAGREEYEFTTGEFELFITLKAAAYN